MDLKNKNILLIVPKFFGYENVIQDTIRKLGANVWIVYENMDEINLVYRWVYVYLPSLKNKIMTRYYKTTIQKIGQSIDICFIIRGASLTKEAILWIKSKNPNSKFIMYQWDSVDNNSNAKIISRYCDKNLTFDPNDSKKYHWIYRPLFYFEDTNLLNRKYDLTFIGSVHSKRLNIANVLLNKHKTKNYVYLYSKLTHFIKQKYIKRNPVFRTKLHRELHFSSLSIFEANKIFANSKIVVDYTHPDQVGYTMRTIESLGHHCKLLTNNKQIINADFYDRNNIYVYDHEFDIPDSFLKTQYHDIPEKVYAKYSITNWIRDILG